MYGRKKGSKIPPSGRQSDREWGCEWSFCYCYVHSARPLFVGICIKKLCDDFWLLISIYPICLFSHTNEQSCCLPYFTFDFVSNSDSEKVASFGLRRMNIFLFFVRFFPIWLVGYVLNGFHTWKECAYSRRNNSIGGSNGSSISIQKKNTNYVCLAHKTQIVWTMRIKIGSWSVYFDGMWQWQATNIIQTVNRRHKHSEQASKEKKRTHERWK